MSRSLKIGHFCTQSKMAETQTTREKVREQGDRARSQNKQPEESEGKKHNKSREIQDNVPKKGLSVQKERHLTLGGAEHPSMC